MSKLHLILLFPLIAVFVSTLPKKYLIVTSKIFPLLAFLFLYLLYSSSYGASEILNLGQGGLALALEFDYSAKIFLFLIGALWFLFSIYAPRYFILARHKNPDQFNILLSSLILLLTLIILSKNLITALLFYQILAVVIYYFANILIIKTGKKSAENFSFLMLSSPIFLFIATALTYKITGSVEFSPKGVFFASQLSEIKTIVIIGLYFLALCAIAFVPLYLLYRNLYYLTSPVSSAILLLGFGFINLLLLFKVINLIFGAKIFFLLLDNINYYNWIIIAIGLNLIATAILAILAKNLKQILNFLFFNQLIWVIFSFVALRFASQNMVISLFSFVFSFAVIFFCVGNISLYLIEAKEKHLNGILYKLRISVALLILAFLNIIGLAPTIGGVEKYLVLKQIIAQGNLIAGIIFILNTILMVVLLLKIIYPMFEIAIKDGSDREYEIAKDIEYDLSLILPILFTAIAMVAFIFSYKFLNF
jgi:multicomponent Na+:H+ antiporter subunit D